MNSDLIKKISITLVLLISVFASHSSWLDNAAENYTEQGIKRALVTYGISRGLNGVISVAQGTEVAVSPAGVGLTFAPGQILDPVNDLIERFSWVVMISGTSLGIQRLFLEISSATVISGLLSVLVIIYLAIIWFFNQQENNKINWQYLLIKSLVVLIFIRFSVPVIALLNEGVYLSYLQPRYEEAQSQLEKVSDKIKFISESSQKEVNNKNNADLFRQLEIWLDKTKRSLDIEQQMQLLKQAAADVSQQVINMIVVFVVQTIIFPLLFLWLLIRSAKMIMHWGGAAIRF